MSRLVTKALSVRVTIQSTDGSRGPLQNSEHDRCDRKTSTLVRPSIELYFGVSRQGFVNHQAPDALSTSLTNRMDDSPLVHEVPVLKMTEAIQSQNGQI